ncbi:unnamed protein product [Adineta steineri]|uniref:Parahox neighbor n=3 Tax=Adineta steineri TaxID=433720 RepID=A0A815GKP9_9BILA|nr:unnamed protein product [Adineta steineri]CAF3577172.1 unnamed protein product [Adineta steineri]
MPYYPRNMHGYGQYTPNPHWPNDAHIAVQFVLNYEEGGENNILHGDEASEAFLSEIVGAAQWPGQRHWNMESIYEYGARAGFWRLHRLFTEKNIPVTIYAIATALMRSPAQVTAMQAAGWEIASHGYKWVEHKDMPEDIEREHIRKAIYLHRLATGHRPTGWYTGRCSVNTINLVNEEGGCEYISDTYDDDLPYWYEYKGKPQLIIPYTLDANDMRFATPQGFSSGEQFYTYLKDQFDTLYEEGKKGHPKMMTVGLHCRLIGRPGRISSLVRFINYIQGQDKVWVPTRLEIALHWKKTHPYVKPDLIPSQLDRETFISRFGLIFEQSSWIAERAFDGELAPANNTAHGLHFALRTQFRAASDDERLKVLVAHPNLARKLAVLTCLTAESTNEHLSSDLDMLTDEEREIFTDLNEKYTTKFGFPFIIAVKDNTKASILDAIKRRLENDRENEFQIACTQVERITYLRLKAFLLD